MTDHETETSAHKAHPARKPLAHIKVLDFSAVYAGPICARMLSDCGADVIKIETPGSGDVIRGPKGISRIFSHFNAGKQSIAIDLKSDEGQAVAHRLILESDVIIENFRPGVMKQFGLDYDSVKKIREDVVYCSISGFGQTGPHAQRAAYAPIAHVASGFDTAHQRSQPQSEKPAVWSIMIADMLTGTYAFGAIQTALLGRSVSGKGEYIDVAMLEAMMSLIPGQIQTAQIPRPPQTGGGFHPIKTQDGHIMVCIVSPKNMKVLCDAIQRPELFSDERFKGGMWFINNAAFIDEIEKWSTKLSSKECENTLNKFGVPCSGYYAAEDLFDHPQVISRDVWTEQEDEYGAYKIQNAPFKFSSFDVSTSSSSPRLGQHTDIVLSERLGLSKMEITKLREKNIIA